MRIETYHTGTGIGCTINIPVVVINYNFDVLKQQFVALSSLYPRCYRKTYPRPHGTTAKTVPIPVVLKWYLSLSPWDYGGICSNTAITVQLSTLFTPSPIARFHARSRFPVYQLIHWQSISATIRYDTRCYFNVCSKADI